MPSSISLPPCLMESCKALFPDLDFSRITFYVGMPPTAGSPKGFTMSSGGPGPDINIYLREYKPCSRDTFLTIAHELVHAVQIQGMTGGGHIPGSWGAYYLSHWLGCGGRGSHCENELEKEAYDFSDGGCDGNGKLNDFIDTEMHGALPCECSQPWPRPNSVDRTSYADHIRKAGLVKKESSVGRTWCSLLNFPLTILAAGFSVFGFTNLGGAIGSGIGVVAGGIIGGILGGLLGGPLGAILGAALGAYLGGIIGGAIGWFIDNLFSGPSARIWFTAWDGANWVIPDIPISQDGHTKTTHGPALAVFGSKLYTAYKADSGTDLWYNWLDASGWQVQDKKITQNGHTKTSEAPALAEFNGKLYMAYKSGSSTDLWYNTFDGTNWLPQDIKITAGGHTKTSKGPALAAYNGKLYMAYKSASTNELWYNVFDGTSWLSQDIKITRNGHTYSNEGPALAVFNGLLYMAYKSASSTDIWYNVFDGSSWLAQDIKITTGGHTKTSATPGLAVFNGLLYMAYRSGSSSDIWYNTFDGNDWLAQDKKITTDGKVKTGRGPALAAVGTNYLVMVYRDDS